MRKRAGGKLIDRRSRRLIKSRQHHRLRPGHTARVHGSARRCAKCPHDAAQRVDRDREMMLRRRTHLRNPPRLGRGHRRQPGRAARRCRRNGPQSPGRAMAPVRLSGRGRPRGPRRSDERNSNAALVAGGGSRFRVSVARHRPAFRGVCRVTEFGRVCLFTHPSAHHTDARIST